MGREVVEDGCWGGGRNTTAATSGQITCLIPHYVASIGWSAVNSLTRGYTPVRFAGSQGLSTLPCWKITLLIDQVVGWQRMATSACSPWVHTWPCLSVLVVEPEIDRHASMRAMESLAIPFEQPAHSDWAAHRGKQRFTKPAYANSINRFKPALIEIQGRNLEKESKRDKKKKTERDILFGGEKGTALHYAVILQKCSSSMLQTPLLPIQTAYDRVTPSCVYTSGLYWPLVALTGTHNSRQQIMAKR